MRGGAPNVTHLCAARGCMEQKSIKNRTGDENTSPVRCIIAALCEHQRKVSEPHQGIENGSGCIDKNSGQNQLYKQTAYCSDYSEH